jgi:thioredoxin 1
MSKQRNVDVYVKFSKYNNGNISSNGSLQESKDEQNLQSSSQNDQLSNQNIVNNDRFNNGPPPSQNQQSQQPHRVIEFDSEKLYNLLSNQSYHYNERGPTKILVKVYTDWCGPCKSVAPKVKELSLNPNYNDILFISINGEKISEKLKKYINVSAVPVFFGFVAGKQYGDYIVGPDVKKITQLCNAMSQIQPQQ